MNSLVKNILKNTVIYTLIYSMVFSSFITGSSTSLLNSLLEAHAAEFVHGSPADAACGVCSEAYENPPFTIGIYRGEEAKMPGTNGTYQLWTQMNKGLPLENKVQGQFVVWVDKGREGFGERIHVNKTRYVQYAMNQSWGIYRNTSGTGGKAYDHMSNDGIIGDTLSIIKDYSSKPANGVFYSDLAQNGEFKNKDQLIAYVNAFEGQRAAKKTAADRALGYVFDSNGAVQGGGVTEFNMYAKFNEVFNPDNLDYGESDLWDEATTTEAWYRYLDFLLCCYAAAGTNEAASWRTAIDDYINGNTEGNPIAIVLQPGVFGVIRSQGVMRTVFISAYDFISTTYDLHSAYRMNSDQWWSTNTSNHGNFFEMWKDSVKLSAANDKDDTDIYSRTTRTQNKSARDLYSWGIGALLPDKWVVVDGDGNVESTTANDTPGSYMHSVGLDKVKPSVYAEQMHGFALFPAPAGQPAASFGALQATPDNYIITTPTIPTNVTLTLYGGVAEEDLGTWVNTVNSAKQAGRTFKIRVDWSSNAKDYGLSSRIVSNPVELEWSPDMLLEWLTNRQTIVCYDVLQGQTANSTSVMIDYTANITVTTESEHGKREYKGSASDLASFVMKLDRIGYTSTPEAYSEFKNFGVNSDYTGNLSEDFEAMAGVPSTEQLYFAAGGSEFIVDVTLNEVNDETAYRTYDFYYSSVPCENKEGDSCDEKTWTVKSYTGILGAGSDYTINVHNGDVTVSQTISGTIKNDAEASKTALHEVSIPHISNSGDMSQREQAYNSLVAWYEAAQAFPIDHTSVSDKVNRKTTLGEVGSCSLSEDWGEPADTSASAPCQARPGSGEAGKPGYVAPIPCGNEMATVSKGADYNWTMTATITIPAHCICGPCCEHDITEIHDTWTTSFTYDSMEINDVHVWRLDQGAIEGLEEIIGVDVVGADIVTEAPNIWYNIALKNDPDFKNKNDAEGYGGATNTNHADVGRVWYSTYREQMDSVTLCLGARDNFCDGTSKTDGTNVTQAGGGGHAEVWGKKGFTYENCVDPWSVGIRVGSSHKGEIDSTLNPGGSIQLNPNGGYSAVKGVHELMDKTDEFDKTTKEYKGFLQERDRKSGVTMVTDFLILQTTGGDQSVMYYEQSASSSFNQDSEYNPVNIGALNPNYAHGEIGGAIAGTMWYGNGLSAANWDPYHIYVGSYNGEYNSPSTKFGRPQSLGHVTTSFDGAYFEANMKMQDRPLRPTHKLMIYEGDLNIVLSNKNDAYYTGYSEAFWSNQLHWANINYERQIGDGSTAFIYKNSQTQRGMFTALAPYSTSDFQFKKMSGSGYTYDSGATLIDSTEKFTGTVSEDFGSTAEKDEKNLGLGGHQFGISEYQEHAGYTLEALYSDGYDKCNDIIIYNPVSTQDTQLITLPRYRDQRTAESVKGGAADLINKIQASQVCPEEPGLCDHRTLNCKFYQDQLIFHADFDTQIDGNFVNLASKDKDKDGNTTYDSYTLPTGMSLDRYNSSVALRAFATRLPIPFVDLGITFNPSTVLKVDADITIEPNGSDQMIFSFNGYGLYLPAKDENGKDSNRFVYFTTGNGMERKVKLPLADGKRHHITVEFSMSSLDYCKVLIDGTESGFQTINESNTISSSLIGSYFNVGSWNKNNNYNAAFYLDNLKITRKAGSVNHNETCYTREMTHGNSLNAHRHTAACLAIESTSPDVVKDFGYTGGVQQFTIPVDGFYTLETWGAQGGGAASNLGSHGGLGGYTSATGYFRKGEKLYIYVGGQGSLVPSGEFGGEGYNGGGFGASNGYGGGGMTHISTSQNPANNKRKEAITQSSGSQEFKYTGGVQQFTAPTTGNYTFELYGAQGGNDGNGVGGLGGKTTGTLSLLKGQTIYIVVGGQGASAATGNGGGYNGGGHAGSSGSSGAGGGATHIATKSGTLASLADYPTALLLVAGGGGGGGNSYAGINGGAGGGESHNAPDGSYDADYKFGKGQNRAETKGNLDGGGGGGGYYGGYASYGDGGGAGGTGYISSSAIYASTQSGVNSGNGKVVVTWNIYVDNSAYSETWDSRGTLVLAGGGGGADNAGGTIGDGDDGSGGHGGGLTAQGPFVNGVVQSNKVATQSSGYKHGVGQSATTLTDTGGAGGGWYGGYATNHNNGGGGGGSSYVYGYNGVNRTEITDLSNVNRQFKNIVMKQGVNSGNGKAKITKVGSVLDEVLASLNGNGSLPESEVQKYFGDAYEYLKKEDPVTILKSYSDFKNGSNGFYSLQTGTKPDVKALDDGSIKIKGSSGYEAALSTDIEAGALKQIEIIYAKGSTANSAGVRLNNSKNFSANATTNENGDKVCKIDVSSYADTFLITDVYFDLGSSGYSTIKQINFKGAGTTSTEIREYDIASGGLINGTVNLWSNPFGASVYRITLVGGAGGDGRIDNTTNIVAGSGGKGATLTGKSPIPAGSDIAITVGGKGQDQASTSSVSQGNRVAFNYTGGEQVYTAPKDGRYYLETYGASGGGATVGTGASHGGKGGYSSGYVDLKKGDKLYIYVGGQGTQSSGFGSGGGYNGGGHGGPAGYGGGGMTHISTTRNPATAKVEITSKPADSKYYESTIKIGSKGSATNGSGETTGAKRTGTAVKNPAGKDIGPGIVPHDSRGISNSYEYKVLTFVSEVTGTMDLTFYCGNGHMTHFFVRDSIGNETWTNDSHLGNTNPLTVTMKNLSLIQGATYELYLYSYCDAFANTNVLAYFSTQGGITESYKAMGSWNPNGTIMVAGGGGGADNGGGTVNGADDGSGGYGGGTSGEAAKVNGVYTPSAVTVYNLNNKMLMRSGTEQSGSTAICNDIGEGVYGPYVPYLAGQTITVTVKGTNLGIGSPVIYTCYGTNVLTNLVNIISRSDKQVVYKFTVPENLTCKHSSGCDPYSIWEFCWHQTSAGTMTVESVTLDNGGGNGTGLPGTQSSGFKQGVGESATKSATGYGDIGGAGAGWYGGYTTNHGNGGGAGGSGYISPLVLYGETVGDKRSGNGLVYIHEPLDSRPSNADGKGGYNGGGHGGIEFGESSPESSAGGGGMTDMKVDGNYFAIAAGGGGAGSSITSAYGGLATKTAHGKTWARVLYQDISSNTNYFTTSNMGNVDQTGLYSCLSRLEDFRGKDGKFEFMLEYPDSVYYSGTPNIWKQTSNPYTEQKTNGGTSGANATGFEAISYPMSSSGYGGGLEYNGGSCVLDGAVNHGNWWLCVGIMNASYSPTNGDHGRAYTMPGPVGVSGSEGVSKVALWVRIDNSNVTLNSGNSSALGGDAGTYTIDGQKTNNYTAGGTQDSGYRNEQGVGVGQDGQNGIKSKNYGTVGGGGAGWYGGAQIKEYAGTGVMGGAGGSSYLANNWTEFESYATNRGDGSFDLNEFRETLIVKKSNYDSGITTEIIMKYYTLIPDYLPDGTANPLWSHCNGKNNIHICGDNCGVIEILTCTEPHHKGTHYNTNNEICWEACMNDANHKINTPAVSTDGSFNPGNFINLDYGFEIFFPNRALLDDGEFYGLGALTSARGKGYTDIYEANENYSHFKSEYSNIGCCSPINGWDNDIENNPYLRGVTPQLEPGSNENYLGSGVGMNTTKWTRVKRIKFDVDVIYDPTPTGSNKYSSNAQLYLAGEWIYLGDRGLYEGELGGVGHEADEGKYDPTAWSNYGTYLYDGIYKDRYQFYCVMENNEAKAASYTVEVTSLNADSFDLLAYGQKNDNNEVTNKHRSSNFTSKHGGINKNYYDVVGRIGNLMLEDTEDFRFSNLFKQTVEQMDNTNIITDMFYVNKGLVLKDTEGLENRAEIHGNYVVTGSTGSFAAVKGYNATQNFYKVEIVGKSLTAGRLAVVDTENGFKELTDDKFTNIQFSANKVSYYVDMTGLTNPKTVIDIKYIAKASNTMVVESILVSKLGKSPDGWVLDGIVQEVDQTKQKTVFDWVADIRGIKLGPATKYQNTWGAIPWVEKVDHLDLPLSPDKNNIDILKDEPMLVGYNGLFDIQTLGNYWANNAGLQIIPYYWAIEHDTNRLIKLDVYMQHDGAYEPINIWGNIDKNSTNSPILNEIYNDVVNLDWDNENARRNYYSNDGDIGKIVFPDRVSSIEDLGVDVSDVNNYLDTNNPNTSEMFRTLAVWLQTLPSRKVLEEQQNNSEFGNSGISPDIETQITGSAPVNIPGGHINTLGNRQYLQLDGNARTFVGGISTYGKLQDLNGRIMDYLWYKQGQRWHFTVGLPSASVFVEHGKEITLAEIKRIQEDGYTILCSLNITATGTVYNLQYKHRFDGSTVQSNYPNYDSGSGGTSMGSIGIIERDKNGNIITNKYINLNDYAASVGYDPIVFVYNPAIDSGQDVEIVGTH